MRCLRLKKLFGLPAGLLSAMPKLKLPAKFVLLAIVILQVLFAVSFLAVTKRDAGEDFANVAAKQRIVIIGAGPTALGAFYRLHKLGIMHSDMQLVVLEQETKPGGLAMSVRDDDGFLWDMGGHVVFSHYKLFDTTIHKALQEWNQRVRAAYAFMKGSDGRRRFIPYPVQNNLYAMEKTDREKSLEGLQTVVNSNDSVKPANFEEWLVKNFGQGLCDTFMKKYNRKVWTVDPEQMNAVWVGERVAVPDLEKIRNEIVLHDSGQKTKNSDWGPNHYFRFPKYNGTGGIWQAVADKLPSGIIHFQQKVTGVNINAKKVTILPDGHPNKTYTISYDFLVSTAPLDAFLNMIEDEDSLSLQMKELANQFMYSHTHVLGIGLHGQPPPHLSDKSWMYFPDSDSPFYRVTVFSNYSDDHVPDPRNYWSLMCEAAEPMVGADPDYWNKDKLLEETVDALIRYKFITKNMVASTFYRRLEHGYPIPFLHRDTLLNQVQPWLESNNVFSRGRFGGWRYEVGNQDHSFMQGVEVADRIMLGTAEDTYPNATFVNSMKARNRSMNSTFSVNADYEVVVSHYDEDLDWLKPYANHCHIYHKGKEVIPRYGFQQWEILPNVGRESHTYLVHIIRNYDNLANVTVFVQGSVKEHTGLFFPSCTLDLSKYVEGARTVQLQACDYHSTVKHWGRIKHTNKWKKALDAQTLRKANNTLGEFWEIVFGYPHPPSISFCWSACFGVAKERILQYPKSFYERIIAYVSDHPDPEEGHYMERFWVPMFSTARRRYSNIEPS